MDPAIDRTVYPRACGATMNISRARRTSRGLSPRMRGNLDGSGSTQACGRSIPAHAGQPSVKPVYACMPWVYPRACGATLATLGDFPCGAGLSPRMRGNLNSSCRRLDRYRSIPAHAGQPTCRTRSSRTRRVYPRACGATYCNWYGSRYIWGLSPRMRGNR